MHPVRKSLLLVSTACLTLLPPILSYADRCARISVESADSADGTRRVVLEEGDPAGFRYMRCDDSDEWTEIAVGEIPVGAEGAWTHYHLQAYVADDGRGFIVTDSAGAGSVRFYGPDGTLRATLDPTELGVRTAGRSMSHYMMPDLALEYGGLVVRVGADPGSIRPPWSFLIFPEGRLLSDPDHPDLARLLETRRPDPTDEEIAELVARLDASDWETREEADRSLRRVGIDAFETLTRFAERADSPESRSRLDRILSDIAWAARARTAGLDRDIAFLIDLLATDPIEESVAVPIRERLDAIAAGIRPDTLDRDAPHADWRAWWESIDPETLRWNPEEGRYTIAVGEQAIRIQLALD